MTNEEKKRKLEELDQLFSEAESSPKLQNPMELMATLEDLPDLPEVEMYDYDTDINVAAEEGKEVVNSMAGLYLNNNEEVLNHPYIKKKIEHDALNHGDMIFLRKMAQRVLIMQMKEIDLGNTTPRHFETFYAGLREMREINKQSTATQSVVESFYKTLKDDLGIQDKPMSDITDELKEDSNITDQKALNTKLNELLSRMNKNNDLGH
jgi:hypothetical protein